MVIIGDVKHDIDDLLEYIKTGNSKDFFSEEELRFLSAINRDPKEEMKIEFAISLGDGWDAKMLKNGKVFSVNGEEISDLLKMKEILKWDGEIRFYAENKKTEDVIEFLENKDSC